MASYIVTILLDESLYWLWPDNQLSLCKSFLCILAYNFTWKLKLVSRHHLHKSCILSTGICYYTVVADCQCSFNPYNCEGPTDTTTSITTTEPSTYWITTRQIFFCAWREPEWVAASCMRIRQTVYSKVIAKGNSHKGILLWVHKLRLPPQIVILVKSMVTSSLVFRFWKSFWLSLVESPVLRVGYSFNY